VQDTSAQPAKRNALAYAQGSDIPLANCCSKPSTWALFTSTRLSFMALVPPMRRCWARRSPIAVSATNLPGWDGAIADPRIESKGWQSAGRVASECAARLPRVALHHGGPHGANPSGAPVVASQRRRVLSPEPETMRRPSGLKATEDTKFVWP